MTNGLKQCFYNLRMGPDCNQINVRHKHVHCSCMVLYTFVVSSVYELKINPTSIEIADKYVDTLVE